MRFRRDPRRHGHTGDLIGYAFLFSVGWLLLAVAGFQIMLTSLLAANGRQIQATVSSRNVFHNNKSTTYTVTYSYYVGTPPVMYARGEQVSEEIYSRTGDTGSSIAIRYDPEHPGYAQIVGNDFGFWPFFPLGAVFIVFGFFGFRNTLRAIRAHRSTNPSNNQYWSTYV